MSEKLKTKDKKALIVRLPPEMIKKLKHLAVDSEKSLNSLIEEAIVERLKRASD